MNLGMLFPQTPKHHVMALGAYSSGGVNQNCNPRKVKFICPSGSTTGTVAQWWDGEEIVSEEAQYWPDDETWLQWEAEHPDHPDSILKARWTLEERTPGAAGACNYWAHLFVESWFEDVKIADFEQRVGSDLLWRIPWNLWNWFDPWQHRTAPSLWFTRPIFVNPALWEDDPGYQPYNTRP